MVFPITILNIWEICFWKGNVYWSSCCELCSPWSVDPTEPTLRKVIIVRSMRRCKSFCLILENRNWEKHGFSFCVSLEPLMTRKMNIFFFSSGMFWDVKLLFVPGSSGRTHPHWSESHNPEAVSQYKALVLLPEFPSILNTEGPSLWRRTVN